MKFKIEVFATKGKAKGQIAVRLKYGNGKIAMSSETYKNHRVAWNLVHGLQDQIIHGGGSCPVILLDGLVMPKR